MEVIGIFLALYFLAWMAPDAIASVNTGLGPYTGGSCPAEVVAARYAE